MTGCSVLLHVKNCIRSQVIDTPIFDELFSSIDIMFFKCSVSFKHLLLICIYITPSTDSTLFESFFEYVEQIYILQHMNILIMGDINATSYNK